MTSDLRESSCGPINDFFVNIFPQILQWYGLSPVWLLIWTNKLLLSVKVLPRVLQEYGFSPVCTTLCLLSADEADNLFLQVLQFYGSSPVWILMWANSLQ